MKRKALSSVIIACIFTFGFLAADLKNNEIPLKMKFSEMDTFYQADGRQVEIRGFLYDSADGKKFLSNEPNLRTCCVGTKNNRKKQILIKGDIASPKDTNPVTIQGLLQKSEHAVGDGNEVLHLYHIDNAIVVPRGDNAGQGGVLLLLLTMTGVGGLFFFLRLRRGQLRK